jgi:hypothetical protein
MRVEQAGLDPTMQMEAWDETTSVRYDRALLNDPISLRFLDANQHATIVGQVGVGKTFLAHALGHIARRRGASVVARRGRQGLPHTQARPSRRHPRAGTTQADRCRPVDPRRLRCRRDGRERKPRRLRDPRPTESLRIDHGHSKPRPRRLARHRRGSRPRAERHRPFHQQVLRPGQRPRRIDEDRRSLPQTACNTAENRACRRRSTSTPEARGSCRAPQALLRAPSDEDHGHRLGASGKLSHLTRGTEPRGE